MVQITMCNILENKMKALIISGFIDGIKSKCKSDYLTILNNSEYFGALSCCLPITLDQSQYEIIIACDSGLVWAKLLGIHPTHYIGDGDSLNIESNFVKQYLIKENIEATFLPVEKDASDCEIAIRHVCRCNFDIDEINIIGGLGGRMDHCLGNISILEQFNSSKLKISFCDFNNNLFILQPGKHLIKRDHFTYFSLFSAYESCHVEYVHNSLYDFDDEIITNTSTKFISNQWNESVVEICIKKGSLLVVKSRDPVI